MEQVKSRIHRKEIGRPLSLEEERFRAETLLESIGEGLIVTDAQGIIIKVNKAAKEILGFSEREFLGKPYSEIVLAVDDRNNVLPKKEHLISRVLKGRTTQSDTAFYLTSKRRKFPVFLTISPVIVRGKLTGVISVFRDITEERAVDRAKTEFVSLASHQLRTPLATIKWYTQMLLGGDAGALNLEQRDYLNEVLQSSEEMTKLLNIFLNVSRLELGTFAVEPELTDAREVAESVIREIIPNLQNKKIVLKKKYASHLQKIQADQKFLRIIFQNLLTNSVKYTPEGGTIELAISLEGKRIVIAVRDTGFGIPEDEQSQIFKKMFRASNAKSYDTDGVGLGLYLIKSILDSVGGTIRFDSKEGWGTTFYVTLPLSGMKPKKGPKRLE